MNRPFNRCAVMRRVSALGGMMFALSSLAATTHATEWDFSGFASIGAGRIDEPSLTFMDYNDDWSFDSDSVLGLQVLASPTQRFSITGQVLARGHYFNDKSPYEPTVAWLFGSYDLSESLRIRAGRLRTPLFLYSESLDIGYSYPWVRPPVSVYSPFLTPFSNYEGVDMTWTGALGSHETQVALFIGQLEDKYNNNDVDVDTSAAFTVQTDINGVLLRGVTNFTQITSYEPQQEQAAVLLEGIARQENVPLFYELADNLRMENEVLYYNGLALQWEPGAWHLVTEKFYLNGTGDQFSSDADGWYASVARQFGRAMPYVVIGEYAVELEDSILESFADSYDVLPAGQNPFADVMRSLVVENLSNFNVSQGSVTLGCRYDLGQNIALKAEVEYFRLRSNGQMQYVPDLDEPGDAVATTFVVDMVF